MEQCYKESIPVVESSRKPKEVEALYRTETLDIRVLKNSWEKEGKSKDSSDVAVLNSQEIKILQNEAIFLPSNRKIDSVSSKCHLKTNRFDFH